MHYRRRLAFFIFQISKKCSIPRLFMAWKVVENQSTCLLEPGKHFGSRWALFIFPNFEFFSIPRLFMAQKIVENPSTCLLGLRKHIGRRWAFLYFSYFLSEIFKMSWICSISNSNVRFYCQYEQYELDIYKVYIILLLEKS